MTTSTASTRRRFISWLAAGVVAGAAAGCGEAEVKQTGTSAENPQDIQDALNNSSAGYETETKGKKK